MSRNREILQSGRRVSNVGSTVYSTETKPNDWDPRRQGDMAQIFRDSFAKQTGKTLAEAEPEVPKEKGQGKSRTERRAKAFAQQRSWEIDKAWRAHRRAQGLPEVPVTKKPKQKQEATSVDLDEDDWSSNFDDDSQF